MVKWIKYETQIINTSTHELDGKETRNVKESRNIKIFLYYIKRKSGRKLN